MAHLKMYELLYRGIRSVLATGNFHKKWHIQSVWHFWVTCEYRSSKVSYQD